VAKKSDLLKWVTAFPTGLSRGGFMKTQRFIEYLFSEIKKPTFEELEVPLLVVAAGY
jgi:hypothetical protein